MLIPESKIKMAVGGAGSCNVSAKTWIVVGSLLISLAPLKNLRALNQFRLVCGSHSMTFQGYDLILTMDGGIRGPNSEAGVSLKLLK
jgi:hypothetical protein